MSLIQALLERPAKLCIASKYTAMNGIVCLSSGALLTLWPGAVQAIFRDRAFVGDEQALIRALGRRSSSSAGSIYSRAARAADNGGCVRRTEHRAVGPLTSAPLAMGCRPVRPGKSNASK
jgi:hypothetical protein